MDNRNAPYHYLHTHTHAPTRTHIQENTFQNGKEEFVMGMDISWTSAVYIKPTLNGLENIFQIKKYFMMSGQDTIVDTCLLFN